jgi:hypothetical protein
MQINIAGKLWMQAIPTATLAPYVKKQIMMQNRWCSDSAIRLVTALCEGPETPIRKVWKLQQYKKYVEDNIPRLDIAEIEKMAMKNEHIFAAANSSGMLLSTEEPVGTGNYGAAGNFQHQRGNLIRQRQDY